MKNMSCENIQDIVVDYSDGLLSPEESGLVSQHLENCERCRKLHDALNHSLELANVIWQDNLEDTENTPIEILPRVQKVDLFRNASIAASILILITVSVLWNSYNESENKISQITFREIEQSINDSAKAARLIAAAQILENYPDYKDIAKNQYHYIEQKYPAVSDLEKQD